MADKHLSVVIPHYNSPEKLRRMLKSISASEDIQVIVVDDISTEALDDYQLVQSEFKNVEFYSNSLDNKGAGGARNVGLKHAIGEWILFGDADDYFASNVYEIVGEYFESDCDVVFFPMDAFLDDGTGRPSDRCAYYTSLANRYYKKHKSCQGSLLKRWKMAPIEREIRNNWLSPCSKMVRREFIEKEDIHFEVVKYANDNYYSVQVGCKASKVLASNKIIYHVTESVGTLTNNSDSSMKQIRSDVWNRCLKYIDENENKTLKFRAQIAKKIWGIKDGEKA